jgi:enoyl-[acyl-carrier protein] reductase II
MNTRITELLNIKYPIIQGGMVLISDAVLAAAVSNAGGAGIIGAGGHDAEWLLKEIRKARELTENSFGVNVALMSDNIEEIFEVISQEKPKFVTFGGGNPIPFIDKVKENGIIAIPVIASLYHAIKVEKAGADAVVAEGMEAGGHIGKQTTMSLMSNILGNINIPLIAAGGISDYKGVKAVLAMGTEGVQMGSRFMLSEECPVHINVKQKIIEATDMDSEIVGYTIGHSVRVIKNKFVKEYLSIEYSDAPRSALKGRMKGASQRGLIEGDVENGYIQVGQSLNVLNEIMSCKDIIEGIVEKL